MPEVERRVIRIAGTTLDAEKKALVSLTKIPGIGFTLSNAILRKLNLDPQKKLSEYTDEEIEKLEEFFKDPYKYELPPWLYNRQRDPITGKNLLILGSDIKLYEKIDIDRLKKMGSYRGLRHSLGLKVRGQRTRTTGRRGPTIGYVRKKK